MLLLMFGWLLNRHLFSYSVIAFVMTEIITKRKEMYVHKELGVSII